MLPFGRLASTTKVLIVAPFPPDRQGLHGGAQVIGRLVEELAERFSVAVLYLRSATEATMERALVERCALVEEVQRPSSGLRRHVRLLGALVRGSAPMWVEDWCVPAFADRLRGLANRWDPDIVQFETHIMAQYAGALPAAKILVVHEPGAASARDRHQASRGWRKLALGRDRDTWLHHERDQLSKFDAVVCFTRRDHGNLSDLRPDARFEVLTPRGPAPSQRSTVARRPNTILFHGNYVHPPNVDAALRLVNSIFPLVRKVHPRAMLQLPGDAPPAILRNHRGLNIEIPGRVPDVKPWLDSAAAVVAPLRYGGGIRIKMMDALAAGKAIVASPLACEGLNLHSGREVLMAESDEDFAAQISTLLSDPAARSRLESNARQWADAFAVPGRAGDDFARLYHSVLKRSE